MPGNYRSGLELDTYLQHLRAGSDEDYAAAQRIEAYTDTLHEEHADALAEREQEITDANEANLTQIVESITELLDEVSISRASLLAARDKLAQIAEAINIVAVTHEDSFEAALASVVKLHKLAQ